jgi:nucleoside-diphosphate-sugar epimerase
MKTLITGAAGFLGTRLARALLDGARGVPGVSTLVAVDTVTAALSDHRVDSRTGTITDADFVRSVVDGDVDVVYHLAAVLSGQSEAEFDVGMRVNVDGTRNLLEACRRVKKPPRFIFTSTVAVYGGPLPPVVPEDAPVRPESSYGAAKAIAELLVSDYSRKGFVDGIACRLPTVAIRPGKPNSAMSSFVSGIIREPLAGIDSVCPVPLDTRLWICSPDVLTSNLVHAGRLDTSSLGNRRAINLPGLSVTAAEMLDSLERLGGTAARARVRCEPDADIMRIVLTWPGAFDVSRALGLGFAVDRDVDSVVRQFMAEPRGDGPARAPAMRRV